METMQLNRFISCLLVVLAAMLPAHVRAQSSSDEVATPSGMASPSDADFEEFVALQGWVFTEGLTKAAGLPDLDGTPSRTGGPSFSAEDFDPESFDPRDYEISFGADVTLPTNFRVGDRGMLQFHSPQRCQDLYERHLVRKAKGQ